MDTAAVLLKTASGKIAQISCSRRATYGYDQRIEVHGAKGMLRAGNVHETTVEMPTRPDFPPIRCCHFFWNAMPPPTAPNWMRFSTAIAKRKCARPVRAGWPESTNAGRCCTDPLSSQTGKTVTVSL